MFNIINGKNLKKIQFLNLVLEDKNDKGPHKDIRITLFRLDDDYLEILLVRN